MEVQTYDATTNYGILGYQGTRLEPWNPKASSTKNLVQNQRTEITAARTMVLDPGDLDLRLTQAELSLPGYFRL